MVIVKSDLSEKEAEEFALKTLPKQVEDIGGNITFSDFWGARGFAYRIKQYKWGYYVVFQAEIPAEKLAPFRQDLSINPSVLRYLLTQVDPNAPEPRKYSEIKKEYEAQEKKSKDDKTEKSAEKEKEETPVKKKKINTVPSISDDDLDDLIEKSTKEA